MNSKTPKESLELPEINPDEKISRPNTGFNINNIPRFQNPNALTPKSSVTLKDKVTQLKSDNPQQQNVARGSNTMPEKHRPVDANLEKKQKAQKKLKRMRAHKHFSTVRFAIISFIVFLIVFNSQFIYSQALYLYSRTPFAPKTQTTITPVTPTDIPTQSAEVVGPENLIIIPKIGVSAPLIFPETIEERAVLRALQDGVVHYSGTANPGENGNSVFFGHSSNDIWEPGNYKFVFVLLEKLTVGDQYEIHYQSRKYIYTVEETKVVEPTELSVLDQTSTPYSTLITCTPPGTNWRRFIVKAKQTQPAPKASPGPVVATQVQPSQQPATLPSAPPTLLEQIQLFFNNLINTILGNSSQNDTQPSTQPTQPTNRLPEVSKINLMPTIF